MKREIKVADMPTAAGEMATVTMKRLSGTKTRFSIALVIQEIDPPRAIIVEERNDNNAPVRRLEQCRDVMVTGARVGFCWIEICSCSICAAARFNYACPPPRAERRCGIYRFGLCLRSNIAYK